MVDEFIAFISGAAGAGDRDLVTLLFTDVVDSTRAVVAAGDDEWRQTLNFLDDLVAARVSRAGGRIVKQTGDVTSSSSHDPATPYGQLSRSVTRRRPSA